MTRVATDKRAVSQNGHVDTVAQRLPRISVVVPTRDRPELLRRAATQILEQTYAGEIELLVVFDQSDPIELPSAGERRVVRALRNTRSPGLAGARNTGVLAATGELVAFCDDDDEWLPSKLEAQAAQLLDHPDAAVAICGVFVCYDGRAKMRLPNNDRLTLRELAPSSRAEPHSTRSGWSTRRSRAATPRTTSGFCAPPRSRRSSPFASRSHASTGTATRSSSGGGA
jgi:glycosyltransferase involved in cell wall biosynthesis